MIDRGSGSEAKGEETDELDRIDGTRGSLRYGSAREWGWDLQLLPLMKNVPFAPYLLSVSTISVEGSQQDSRRGCGGWHVPFS